MAAARDRIDDDPRGVGPRAGTGDVLGWEADWFVATAGGVLRIDSATGRDKRVYARTAGGEPLGAVTHVAADTKGGLFAKTGGQSFRYDRGKDAFEPAPAAAYPDRAGRSSRRG